ncbi:hypothetical protein H5410_022485, partial [Solanum commersonii]
ITANQYAWFIGIKNSTPTIASAIDNLIPAFTFIIADRKIGIKKYRRIWGTIVCVGGAMLLSLYHGKVVIGQYAENTGIDVNFAHSNFFLGPFLLIVCSLTDAIRLIIQGVVTTSLVFFLSSWCIEKKGQLYVSMFNPLLLVISAFFGRILLGEKLYLGEVVGSIIVVAGLYGFLWGKKMETSADQDIEVNKQLSKSVDLELQLPNSND